MNSKKAKKPLFKLIFIVQLGSTSNSVEFCVYTSSYIEIPCTILETAVLQMPISLRTQHFASFK